MNKAENNEKNVVDDLLASAKENFLKYGYEKAALRQICADAGVTTGALYFSFKNKEALFEELVTPTIENLEAVLEKLNVLVVEQDLNHFDGESFDEDIFRFLIENREGMRLLLTRAGGSYYEDFFRKAHELVEDLMLLFARDIAAVDVDSEVVRILANMFFKGIEELIVRDYDQARMESIAGGLRVCMEQGFKAMLEQQKVQG